VSEVAPRATKVVTDVEAPAAAPSEALDDGDHDRFTHLVLEGYTPEGGEFVALDNSVVDSMVNSTPVRALCGKVWVAGRDPRKYPVCPTCREVAATLGWEVPAP
jgi:Protein of unknown function (DUF3039)